MCEESGRLWGSVGGGSRFPRGRKIGFCQEPSAFFVESLEFGWIGWRCGVAVEMSVCIMGIGAVAECEHARYVVGGVQLRNFVFVHGCGED